MNLIHGTVIFLSDWVVNCLQLCCSRLTGDLLVNRQYLHFFYPFSHPSLFLGVAIFLPSLRELQ